MLRRVGVGGLGVVLMWAASCGGGGTAQIRPAVDGGSDLDADTPQRDGAALRETGEGDAAGIGDAGANSDAVSGGGKDSDGPASARAFAVQADCPADKWCWENPLPTGNALLAVSGSSARDVWAVGESGTILHWDGARWRSFVSGVSMRLTGVWAASPTEAWASGVNGTLLRWDGTAWGPGGQPASVQSTYSVAGWVDRRAAAAKTTVWFSDGTGAIRFADGVWSLAPDHADGFRIASLWADGKGVLWAAGTGGVASATDGSGWGLFGRGHPGRFVGVSGDDRGNAWVVGDQGEIARVDARGVASTFANDVQKPLAGVHAFSDTTAWAAGAAGALLHFDGARWRARSSGTSFDLRAVWGATPEEVWVVGDRGTIVRCNETTCAAPAELASVNLAAVWAASPDEAWAVGARGTILHRTVTGWNVVASATTRDLVAVWGSGPNDVWFAGYQVMLHWDGVALSPAPGLPAGANALHGRSADDLWALSDGHPTHWDGTTWTASGARGRYAIFAAGTQDAWIGTFEDSLNTGRWDGQNWMKTTGPPCLSFSGLGPMDIWCAEGSRTVVNHWDGVAWTRVGTSTGEIINAVASAGANTVWYVGGRGALGNCVGRTCAGYDPNAFGGQRTFANETLNAVATFAGDVYVVGSRGAILHRRQ